MWDDASGVAGIEITGRFDKVFDLFVRPDVRDSDGEREMLRDAASRCKETDVFTCDAARIDALGQIGFEQYREWDHIRTRALEDVPATVLPPGFALRGQGGDLEVESPDGTLAAFTTIWLDDVNSVGLFEPVGTEPEFQRQGLARAVMSEGLHRMRVAGMRTAQVEHEITNAPAAALYESLGFTVAYETLGFRAQRS